MKIVPAPKTSERAGGLVDLLQERLALARRRNPRYSLRSFARQLELDHSTLSQVLRGKRPLTAKAVRRIGARLGLSGDLTDYDIRCARGSTPAGVPASGPEAQISLDTFHVISDWHHCAILELTRLKTFRPESRWIAAALGLSIPEVNIALQRLLRLRLLEMDGRRWHDRGGDAGIGADEMTPMLRLKVQQQAHELALDAARMVPADRQEHQSATLAVNSRRLRRLRALMAEFLRDAHAVLGEGGGRDDVFLIECSAFPLTNLNRKKGDSHGKSGSALANPEQRPGAGAGVLLPAVWLDGVGQKLARLPHGEHRQQGGHRRRDLARRAQ
jgi:transcriptional regulator with XRE-family HTH domain